MLRDLDFVSALSLLGYGRTRITVRHILPNCFSETAAYGGQRLHPHHPDRGRAVVPRAPASGPPTPEWGSMMADGRIYLQSAPWLLVGPGIVLTITAFGVSLIGEALKDRTNG